MIYNHYTPITETPVAVPANFCGMHWFGWPGAGSPTPTWLRTKICYQHDYLAWGAGPCDWSDIETSPGVYNWNALDIWMDGQYALGIDPVISHIYMPSFYSANPTTVSAPAGGGRLGCGGPLTASGRVGLTNFVTATIQRYIARGTPVKYWQAWEEPWWPVVLGQGYWWGTAAELVDLSHLTYLAVKAADPRIILLGTSASHPVSGPEDWIGTYGTTYPAVRGVDTYDIYGTDLFGYFPTGFREGFQLGHSPSFDVELSVVSGKSGTWSNVIQDIRNAMTSTVGSVQPIMVCSMGFSYLGDGKMAAYFRSQTTDYRKKWMARSLLEMAALGIKAVIVYGGDSNNYIGGGGLQLWAGDFVNDTNGVIAGFNEIADNVAGKTITFCGYRGDGSMVATFSDGTSYAI